MLRALAQHLAAREPDRSLIEGSTAFGPPQSLLPCRMAWLKAKPLCLSLTLRDFAFAAAMHRIWGCPACHRTPWRSPETAASPSMRKTWSMPSKAPPRPHTTMLPRKPPMRVTAMRLSISPPPPWSRSPWGAGDTVADLGMCAAKD
jgi:hypothetical protein